MTPIELLLIEDSPSDIFLTKEALKACRLPTNVSVVTDGEEAIDFLCKRGIHKAARDVDIILLDLNLPRLGGIEVLKFIRRQERLREIPVIVLTDDKRDIRASYLAGADSYFAKPFCFDSFAEMMARFCFQQQGFRKYDRSA